MKMKRLFWGFTMIAALALLAGCGGGGGTSLMIDGVRATQDLIDAATGARNTAREEVTSLQGQLKTANENAMDLQGQLKKANEMIEDLNKQIANAPTQQMIDDLTTMRNNYKKQAEDLQGDLEDEKEKVTSLQTQIGNLQKQIDDLTNPTADAMAKDVLATIKKNKSTLTAPTGFRSDPANPATEQSPRMVLMADDDFTMEGLDSLGAFAGSVSTKVDGKDTSTVALYTDQTPNTAQRYSVFYADTSSQHSIDTTVSRVTNGVLEFNNAVGSNGKHFSAAYFPTSTDQNRKFAADWNTDDDATTDGPLSFTGTYRTIQGTFTCTGTCTATGNPQGVLTALTGTWTFTPLSQTGMVPGVIKDADFLSFGYWAMQRELANGSMDYRSIYPYFYGEDDFNFGTYSALMGTATYQGAATGMYARTASTPTGETVATRQGGFTADAMLTANFGGGAAATRYEISGVIENFIDGEGNTIDANWRAMLNPIGFAAADGSANDHTFSGGVTTGSGTWKGAFFGDPNADDVPTASERYPNGVAGSFSAGFSNGEVIGAFGATQQ